MYLYISMRIGCNNFMSTTNSKLISSEFNITIILIILIFFKCWNEIICLHIAIIARNSISWNWSTTCVGIACKRSMWVLFFKYVGITLHILSVEKFGIVSWRSSLPMFISNVDVTSIFCKSYVQKNRQHITE